MLCHPSMCVLYLLVSHETNLIEADLSLTIPIYLNQTTYQCFRSHFCCFAWKISTYPIGQSSAKPFGYRWIMLSASFPKGWLMTGVRITNEHAGILVKVTWKYGYFLLIEVKSSILFSQTASHLHIEIHIQNNLCGDGKAVKHSLLSCLPYWKVNDHLKTNGH